MGDDWGRKVFRLRNLPNRLRDATEAASLLSTALDLPTDHVSIYSLAKTSNKWEVPPSKVATLQLKSMPRSLQKAATDEEWSIPLPGGKPSEVVILDIHFRGMTILNDPDPAKHEADCIAISGLASHPFGSWQPRGHDKTFMWIRDAIPQTVPGIRTVIYGYDSKLQNSNSFQSISDLAQSFILRLKAGGWNLPSSKPIIFLAHSLGGLVLKEAVVQIADRDKSVANILDNVLGAIMFGVPSLGMEQSHLLAMVEGQPNEFLVQDLSREGGGYYVRQLNVRFEGLSFLRTAKILWAYETEESQTVLRRADGTWSKTGPLAVLVNPDSATCNYFRKDKSVTIPINEDHSNMVKFSRGDTNLEVILQSLMELCSSRRLEPQDSGVTFGIPLESGTDPKVEPGEDITLRNRGATLTEVEGEGMLIELGKLLASIDELHNTIYTPELDSRMNQIDDPYQNTFHWVFDLPEFSRWLQEGNGLFWIHGKPGSGKSTLMKFIYQSQHTWDLLHNWGIDAWEIRACFFFHYRGSAIQKSFEGVLRSAVTQILRPHRDRCRKVYQPIWEKYSRVKRAQQRLWKQKDEIQGDLEKAERKIEIVRKRIDGLRKQEPAPGDKDLQLRKLTSSLEESFKVKGYFDYQLAKSNSAMHETGENIRALVQVFRPHSTSPTWKLLGEVDADFHEREDGLILKLEKILRRLLDQDIARMDLVLFFDALDEFDGHLDMISRFLKGLVTTSPTSATRVKVCFSSRPWEPLKAHFSHYPNFALQDYTKNDIEEYAAGSVESWDIANPSIISLVPAIIARANGVFLWVTLAIKVLYETATSNPKAATPDALEKKLQGLPSDLFEFYRLVIERISRANRRRTYALLELLVRQTGRPATATQIRDAVLVSGCTSYGDAKAVLGSQTSVTRSRNQVRKDLATWGGGLVEIKRRPGPGDDADYPQLMHQTVLEFTMGLPFKRIVVGNLANFMNENGHSFHVKYWSLRHEWAEVKYSAVLAILRDADAGYLADPDPRYHQYTIKGKDADELQQLAYHAEQAELTTGKSQLDYLFSMPIRITTTTNGQHHPGDWDRMIFLFLIASCGLTLCLRDFLARRSISLELFPRFEGDIEFPLVSSIFFAPPSGEFYKRYLTTFSLLLDSGYRPCKSEPKFFLRLCEEVWRSRFKDSERIPISVLNEVAIRLLKDGQNPNVRIRRFNRPQDRYTEYGAAPLHLAPPTLAAELIRHGADPNATDTKGRSPLTWVVTFPPELEEWPDDWDCALRYEMCKILLGAGGNVYSTMKQSWEEVWEKALAEFDKEGFDTRSFPRSLRNREPQSLQQNSGSSDERKKEKGLRYWYGKLRLGKGK